MRGRFPEHQQKLAYLSLVPITQEKMKEKKEQISMSI
jgi:hypothetical protein